MKSKDTASKQPKVIDFFQSIDLFSRHVHLRSNNKQSYTSSIGAIVSFLIMSVLLIYSSNKFFIMKDHEDTVYQSFDERNVRLTDDVVQ